MPDPESPTCRCWLKLFSVSICNSQCSVTSIKINQKQALYYASERGSAAMADASKKSKVVASAAAAAQGTDTEMQTQAIMNGQDPGPRTAGQKRGAEKPAGAPEVVQRRELRMVTGVDPDFRGKIHVPTAPLEQTRDVKVLQYVMDQVTQAMVDVQKNFHELDARTTLCQRRLDGLDVRQGAVEHDIQKLGTDTKDAGVIVDDHFKDLEARFDEWKKLAGEREKHLNGLLVKQEVVLTERIEEIKSLFVKAGTVC